MKVISPGPAFGQNSGQDCLKKRIDGIKNGAYWRFNSPRLHFGLAENRAGDKGSRRRVSDDAHTAFREEIEVMATMISG
jgi:hypothetical protein